MQNDIKLIQLWLDKKLSQIYQEDNLEEFSVLLETYHSVSFALSDEIDTIGTDGKTILLNLEWVKSDFSQSCGKEFFTLFIYTIFHLILGHPEHAYGKNADLYDNIVDRKVEVLAQVVFGLKPLTDKRTINKSIRFFSKYIGMNDWEIYNKILVQWNAWIKEGGEFQREILDSHEIWYLKANEGLSKPCGEDDLSDKPTAETMGNSIDEIRDKLLQKLKKKLASQNSIQNKYKDTGIDTNISYREIFQQFLSSSEIHKETDAEIDYSLMQFGLDYCEGILLIEPPEVIEEPANINLCIAIDTSGSCQGDLVMQFLHETKRLIQESFEDNLPEIKLIFCDEEIQEVIEINCLEDIDSINDIPCGGGTSFVPVFEYVDQWEIQNQARKLLIYFSDGAGDFPDDAPGYETVFVMEQGDGDDVPSWVQKSYFEWRK